MSLTILNLSDAWSYTAEADNLVRVTAELLARGHRVVLGCSEGTPLARRAAEKGFDVRLLPGLRGRGPVQVARAVRSIRRVVAELDPDIVHAWRSPPHVAAALAIPRGRRTKLVRTRGTMERPKRSPLNRGLYGTRTAVTIVTADAVKAECIASGIPAARLETIYGGIELDRFSPEAHPRDVARRELAPLGIAAETPLVVHLARLAPVKGHAHLIAAAREVVSAFPAARFLLVGPAWPGMEEKVRGMIREAGLEHAVTITGKVEDPARVLGAADLGIVASTGSEALSRAALEYMAMGLPTVATRVGSLPELVEEGRTGLLVDPGDAPSLAGAIRSLLADPDRRRGMGAAARARAVSRFGAEAQVDRLLSIYGRVLG